MEHAQIDTAAAVAATLALSCDLATLSGAVDYLAKRIIETRETIPILGTILVEAEPGGVVRLSATDLDILASIDLAGDVESPGVICIDAHALQVTLAKARKGNAGARVTIEDQGAPEFDSKLREQRRGRVMLKTGRNRFNVPTRARDDFPTIPLSDECAPISFALPAAQFLADLAAVGACASKEESRYYLNGAALQVRELAGQDRLCLVATDGHAIAAASRAVPIGATGLDDVIIPRKAMAIIGHAAKMAGDAGEVQVTAYPARLTFEFGAVRIVAKTIDGTFPDWERPFADNLAPSDASPALFPELLPGAPVASIERIAKAAKGVAIDWSPARQGMLGTVAGDDGMLFGALNMADAGDCQRKGFSYHWQGEAEAKAYLESLAESRGLRSAADIQAECIAINDASDGLERSQWLAIANGEAPGERATYCGARLHKQGTRVVGLTVSGEIRRTAWRETVTDWETLCERRVTHPEQVDSIDGSYSILMPADGPGQLVPESAIEGPDGVTYPVAMSDSAIHLTKEQVRALIGESCFEVMAVPIPGSHPLYRKFRGEPAYVARWLYEQGDSRLLIVKRDGRCFDPAKYARDYLARDEIDALIAGTWQAEGEGAIPETVAEICEEICEPVAVECEPVEAPEPIAIACQPSEDEGSADSVALDSGEQEDALYEAPTVPVSVSTIPTDFSTDDNRLAAMVADLAARVAAIEAGQGVAESVTPIAGKATPIAKPARTPAHERAVRRAWADRKARRAERIEAAEAEAYWEGAYAEAKAEHWQAVSDCHREQHKRRRAVILAHRHWKMRLLGRSQRADIAADERRERAKREANALLARYRGGQMVMLAGVVKRSEAELADLKRSMADPTNPERASDIARLVGERDQARNANAALEQRCARMQDAVDGCAGTIESLASRVAIAEAALRKAA